MVKLRLKIGLKGQIIVQDELAIRGLWILRKL